jgi:hypothetical protein
MLKGLLEVVRCIKDTPIINIGDVDFQFPIFGFSLWCFNCNTSLSGDTANRNLAHSAQKRFIRGVACRLLTKGSSHHVLCRIGGIISKVGRKFRTQ